MKAPPRYQHAPPTGRTARRFRRKARLRERLTRARARGSASGPTSRAPRPVHEGSRSAYNRTVRGVDLDLRELIDFDPRGGVIRFAGQRAVILDAVALGLLRRELIDTVGLTAARGVLTRFGYAHGWRTAEVMKTA